LTLSSPCSGKQSEAQALSLLRDLAQGLDHLHKRSIFHLDIKLDNLVFASGAIKIIDLAGSLDTNKPCGQIFTTSGYETPGNIV
jgi:serine/threonine protein kinase